MRSVTRIGVVISRVQAARASECKRSAHSGVAAVNADGSRPAAEKRGDQSGGGEAPLGESCSGGMRLKNRSRPRESRHTLIMPVIMDGGSHNVTVPAPRELKKLSDSMSRGLWRYQKRTEGGRSDERRAQRACDLSCC